MALLLESLKVKVWKLGLQLNSGCVARPKIWFYNLRMFPTEKLLPLNALGPFSHCVCFKLAIVQSNQLGKSNPIYITICLHYNLPTKFR